MNEDLLSKEQYLSLSTKERIPNYEKNGRLYHVMMSQQFSREFLETIFDTADLVKNITRKPKGSHFLASLLSHKRAMLYFTQPSTRTFLSFLSACQLVGMYTGEVRDPSLSSEIKGESQEDGVRTFNIEAF